MSSPLEEWPGERAAAELIQTSTKTLQRYAAAGKIEVRKRRRRGRKPENVYNPADLERLMPAAHVMPEEPEPAEPESYGTLQTRPNGKAPSADAFFAFLTTISTAIASRQNVAIEAPRHWITLEEAADASGLTAGFIRRAIRDEKIAAVRGGPHGELRIHRPSLEAFAG